VIRGLGGSLLSGDALERIVPVALAGKLGEDERGAAQRRLRAWHRPARATLGPSASPRQLVDRLGVPLASLLGYRATPLSGDASLHRLLLFADDVPALALVVTTWGRDLSGVWRTSVRQGIALAVRWCLCLSGQTLRIFDAGRTYSRRYADIDLVTACDDDATFAVLWGLLRADAMRSAGAGGSLLDQAVALSERHRQSVRVSLQSGVDAALAALESALTVAARRRRKTSEHGQRIRDESLTLVYRLLFLLFAEARGLVPTWHPLYRRAYALESLQRDLEQIPHPTGLWEALQAIARLAHHGCRSGTLAVTAFNGPLFSPALSPLAETLRLDDGAVRTAFLALTTRPGREGRERIAYGDLGVEQLGGVYERLLDSPRVTGRTGLRRETGSYYTPRFLTDTLVRRTLAPLVTGVPPERILALRVLDPAMGSGAFLVSACRYLANAYESALVDSGALSPDDVTPGDRAMFRRLVAQRCLYGVDLNPVAVHLGRLSLWLATLAGDRPLTFLDHHLRSGDSLVGASPDDVLRRPPPGGDHTARPRDLPLFADGRLDLCLGSASAIRTALATEPGDTLEQVRRKERALVALAGDAEIARWKSAADLWCSGWFRTRDDRRRFRRVFDALLGALLTGRRDLPAHTRDRLLEEAEAVARRQRFFHWTLEFPEAFVDSRGEPHERAGFDAVLCNPPWETLRGPRGGHDGSDAAAAADLVGFARSSGSYRWQGEGHANLYQLFTERALSLLRNGGRLGLVLPAGLATDHGCAPLRRALLDTTHLDSVIGLDNRAGLFPIHRGLRFLLITGTAGARTVVLPSRFGLTQAAQLDTVPELGPDPAAVPLTRAFITSIAGESAAFPDIRCTDDRDVAAALAGAPALASADGWRVSFGRELNATDDRGWLTMAGEGLPVLEGKHLQPFTADCRGVRYHVHPQRGAALAARVRYQRPRLAYRDVASSSNRLTLIAAVVPAGVVTTHTLFCLREDVDEAVQHYLCGIFNSFVANFLVRLQVTTHVTTAIVGRLPVPVLPPDDAAFLRVSALARELSQTPGAAAQVALQAAVARLYGLTAAAFRHVLSTFPLVDAALRDAVAAAFTV
jgi:Eco57I restriction-modification methylase